MFNGKNENLHQIEYKSLTSNARGMLLVSKYAVGRRLKNRDSEF